MHFCNSCAKIACCSSELIFAFNYAGSSIQNASEQFVSCIYIYLVNSIFIQLHKQKSNRVRSVNSNSCISVTIQPIRHMFIQTFFLTTANYYQPQNYWLFPLDHPVEYWLIHLNINSFSHNGQLLPTAKLLTFPTESPCRILADTCVNINSFSHNGQLLSTPKLLTFPTKSPCRIVVDIYVNINFSNNGQLLSTPKLLTFPTESPCRILADTCVNINSFSHNSQLLSTPKLLTLPTELPCRILADTCVNINSFSHNGQLLSTPKLLTLPTESPRRILADTYVNITIDLSY